MKKQPLTDALVFALVFCCSCMARTGRTTSPEASTVVPNPMHPVLLQKPLGHDGGNYIYFSTLDGADRTTTVNKAMLSTSPSWSPTTLSPELPLTIPEAIAAARVVVEQTVPEPSKWGVEQVTLDRVGRFGLYVVRWRPIAGGTQDLIQVPVLMTGRAVPLDARKQERQ